MVYLGARNGPPVENGRLRIPRYRIYALALTAIVWGAACRENRDAPEDESVKRVVAQDRKLAKQEESLLRRRGALQRERTRLRDQRAQLISKKLNLSDDDAHGKQAIEQQESKLMALEAKLMKQEVALNQKLDILVEKKSSLVGGLKNSQSKTMLLARREHALAGRERGLARREADLARREKVLADREQALAVRQAKLCPRQAITTVVTKTVPPPRGRSYKRGDVEPVYRAALKAMRVKGILTADLPPGIDKLVTTVRHAVSKHDYTRAKFAADQLLASVRAIRIDRSFIGGKISRLSRVIKRRPPRGGEKAKVAALFRRATASYGDGRFRAANQQLNRIYALLR